VLTTRDAEGQALPPTLNMGTAGGAQAHRGHPGGTSQSPETQLRPQGGEHPPLPAAPAAPPLATLPPLLAVLPPVAAPPEPIVPPIAVPPAVDSPVADPPTKVAPPPLPPVLCGSGFFSTEPPQADRQSNTHETAMVFCTLP
jgi:hypothetical protein